MLSSGWRHKAFLVGVGGPLTLTVVLRVMLTGHQEGQCIPGLEADCGVSDARLWG